MFILSNGKQINTEAIVDAMLDPANDRAYWFDVQTGECRLDIDFIKNTGKANFEAGKNNRYFKVPKISGFIRSQWMADYVAEMIEDEDKMFAKKLKEILKNENPYERFIKALEEGEKGWIYGWDSWEGDNAFEVIKEWFARLPLDIKEKMDSFCDCPICQAVEEGKTSQEELKDAFRKANLKNILDNIFNKENKNC
jgi:hypothetical protein